MVDRDHRRPHHVAHDLVPRAETGLFSLALFALVVVAWDRPVTRWTVPFLFWIWASVHGSFAIGLAYIGLTIIVERDWKALPTAIVAGLSTFLTAHGLGVLEFLLDFSEAGPALACSPNGGGPSCCP